MQYSFADFLQEHGPIDDLIQNGLWEPMGPCIELVIHTRKFYPSELQYL